MIAHRLTVENVARTLQKKVPYGDRGYAYVADGAEIGSVEVIVDLAGIAKKLGRTAMANKSGRSKYMGGLVEVRVISKRRIEGAPDKLTGTDATRL